jgi:hypothetical protein
MVAGSRRDQVALCARLGTTPLFVSGVDGLGASRSLLGSVWPVQGVRCLPSGGTCGWFLWAGEFSSDPGFFEPLTVLRALEARPQIAQYLGLPPGWGFITAEGYEDVWQDASLLVR